MLAEFADLGRFSNWAKAKILIDPERYMRAPHREVLLLRGLAMRGHLVPRRRTRGAAEWTAAAAFLARLGDNGVVWNVLSFWRDAGARRTKTV